VKNSRSTLSRIEKRRLKGGSRGCDSMSGVRRSHGSAQYSPQTAGDGSLRWAQISSRGVASARGSAQEETCLWGTAHRDLAETSEVSPEERRSAMAGRQQPRRPGQGEAGRKKTLDPSSKPGSSGTETRCSSSPVRGGQSEIWTPPGEESLSQSKILVYE